MATFAVSSALICIVICCSFVQNSSANSYYSYESKGSLVSPEIELFPVRDKRYVAEPIERLADNYEKGGSYIKDVKKTDSPLFRRAELVGSVAIVGELAPHVHGIAAPAPPEPSKVPPQVLHENATEQHAATSTPTTTVVPEKPTKKPIEKFTKKVAEIEKTTEKSTSNTTKNNEEDDIDEFPKEITNNTLIKHNITQKQEDHHTYYTSKYMVGEAVAQHYWVDLETEEGVTVNEMLSKSHRRAATVRLTFDFPFYGYSVRNMTVATGGFLYTGDYIHSWLAATQYIAPLMANFDTSMSEHSFVKYRDNGTAFTVEWSNVALQDKKDAGEFTFQVTLHSSGDIVFVYKDIPITVDKIGDTLHPVKVGLSDAYIIDKAVFYIRRKTIYEYHRVTFNRDDIKNWTVIYMKALPTCVNLKDCYSCVAHNTTLPCRWCDSINRCSSGYDRFHQDWTQNSCPSSAINDTQYCSKSTSQRERFNPSQAPHIEAHSKADDSRETRLGHSGMLGVFIVVCFLACLGMWVFHAYRNPHTRFGQVLIKYRPSQWRLRRGEARYTAATIHM